MYVAHVASKSRRLDRNAVAARGRQPNALLRSPAADTSDDRHFVNGAANV